MSPLYDSLTFASLILPDASTTIFVNFFFSVHFFVLSVVGSYVSRWIVYSISIGLPFASCLVPLLATGWCGWGASSSTSHRTLKSSQSGLCATSVGLPSSYEVVLLVLERRVPLSL